MATPLAGVFSTIDSYKRRAAALAQAVYDDPVEALRQHIANANNEAGANLDKLGSLPMPWETPTPAQEAVRNELSDQMLGVVAGSSGGGGSSLADLIGHQDMMATLLRARANNTFKGQDSGAGVHVGYTQPPGTPVDKLFSNFADYGMSKPEQQDTFRAAMLSRAMQDPGLYKLENVESTTQPFPGGLQAQIDAAKRGNTRVQVMQDGTPVAAAGIRKGMLDSIATDASVRGQGVGANLLQYLHDQGLANIYEVPDRSPGFVNIQKQVLGGLAGGP